jgi:hypothetical protein
MSGRRDRLLETVTVTGSQIVMTAEGATALALTTQERGTIAFVVTLETIAILRKDLATAEIRLQQPIGHS